MNNRLIRIGLAVAMCTAGGLAVADEPFLIGLGFDTATAISADGTTVVGTGLVDGERQAVRWTAADGVIGLGFLPDSVYRRSDATDVSADGSVVVGTSDRQAFRWTEEEGLVGLGFHPLHSASYAYGVSADGSVIVGTLAGGVGQSGFRWTATDGIVYLDGIDAYNTRDVSADGTTIVGLAADPDGPYRWNVDGQIDYLGTLPDQFYSVANAISDDGSTVVGGHDGYDAFRWTEEDGMVSLAPGAQASAKDPSADGSVIVGSGYSSGNRWAWIWTAATGMRELADVLAYDVGFDLAGWDLREARGISADGKRIVGHGVDPDGDEDGFLVYLGDPIPCKGDLNGDGQRDADDLATLLASYRLDAGGDLDGDGDTDLSDLAWMLSVYGDACLRW